MMMFGGAPGVDDEVTDRVDLSEEDFKKQYGYSPTEGNHPLTGGVSPSLVKDATTGTIEKWAQDRGYTVNSNTMDYLMNQFFTEKNNATAWERTLEADNTKYQRMVNDMRKAGLNPFIAMNGTPSSASASNGSVGSGSYASRRNQSQQSGTQLMASLLQGIASIAGAALMAFVMA